MLKSYLFTETKFLEDSWKLQHIFYSAVNLDKPLLSSDSVIIFALTVDENFWSDTIRNKTCKYFEDVQNI